MQPRMAALCCNQLLFHPQRPANLHHRTQDLRPVWQHQQQHQMPGRCCIPRQARSKIQLLASSQQRQLITEAAEELAEAKEVQYSYFKAMEAAVKVLYGATLVAGFAFELFGARRCHHHAAAAYADAAEIAPQVHTSQAQSYSETIDPVLPNVALKEYAVGRGGIWALLTLALTQNLLSWVRNRK